MKYSIFCLLILMMTTASADDLAQRRAHFNYMVDCQGCHLPDASGSPGRVPCMKNFLGNFLRVPGGREFIVRVPGVASAMLNNEDLAELVNWLLETYSKNQIPAGFKPYTAAEVGRLRKRPLIKNALVDGIPTRKQLTEELKKRFGIVEGAANKPKS